MGDRTMTPSPDKAASAPKRMTLRVALFGGEGTLGRALQECALAEGAALVSFGPLDGSREKWPTVREILEELQPDLIFNATCAAHRETVGEDDAQLREVLLVEAQRLALEARRQNLRLVHVSSDLVFAAAAGVSHDEDAKPRPRGFLSTLLLDAEDAVRAACPAVCLARTGCLYGGERDAGFAISLFRRLAEGKSVQVGWERLGPPTPVRDAASVLWSLGRADRSGVFHVVSPGISSWAEVAHAAARTLGAPQSLISTGPRGDVPAWLPPVRPSILEPRRLEREGLARPAPWREALETFLHEEILSGWAAEDRRRSGRGS